jgi:hypothetical protein
MDRFQFDSLFSSDTDWELNQYKILGGIKLYRNEFRLKKIYPALDDLLKLNTLLENMVMKKNILSGSFDDEYDNLNSDNDELNLESIEKSVSDQKFFVDLVQWSLPYIKEVIEEGVVLYDFVEKNIKVKQLGILPLGKDEGFYLIPDNITQKMKVYRFKCSLFSSNKLINRTINTRLLEEVDKSLLTSSELIKNYLYDTYKEFPSHASFVCETELDFPYKESLFPLAKRKLIDLLAK